MKKIVFLIWCIFNQSNLFAQKKLALGFGIGNAIKTTATLFPESLNNKYLGFDVNLQYTKSNHYSTYLKYTFTRVTASEQTSNLHIISLDVVHQPKFKLLYAPLVHSSFQQEIGGSITSNFLNYTRNVFTNDAFGNTIKKDYQTQQYTFGLGITYHLSFKLNRFTLVWETEFGKILDNNILNKVNSIHGYGIPIGKQGYYMNMDIELYYALTKDESDNQPKKNGRKTYEFK